MKRSPCLDEEVKLDLGCGDFKPKGYIGIDVRKTCEADIVASALHLPIRSGSVDEIRCHHLIEHLVPLEAEACIKEIYRVLKVNGRAHLKIDRDWSLKRLLKKDPTHKYRYNVNEVLSMVKDFGVKKVKRKIYLYNGRLKNKIFAELRK